MKLTLSLPNENILSVDVTHETTFSSLKLQISVEAGLSLDQFAISKDGTFLSGSDETTMSELGLKDNDLLFIVSGFNGRNLISKSKPVAKAFSPNSSLLAGLDFSSITLPGCSTNVEVNSTEKERLMLLHSSPYQLSVVRERNPELAAVIDDPVGFARVYNAQKRRAQDNEAELERLMLGDQLDPTIQARISELIQQKNIDSQMESALEHYPETFGQVAMLYVNCRVQNHDIKAFVDSGAQTTIMSEACARRCGLDRLVDKRWAGKAYGVGTQTIIGRVHNSLVEIGGIYIPTSFIVLKDQQLDLLIGLDMLKRHQCTIDLKRNLLCIDGRVEAPFLPESELPLSARFPGMREEEMEAAAAAEDAANGLVRGRDNLLAANNSAGPVAAASSAALTTDEEVTSEQELKVKQLCGEGIPRQQAISELRSVNWDVDAAYASYLCKQDS